MKKIKLSKREVEILNEAINGFNDLEIGFKLGLSKNTIATHKKNMRRKLESKNLYKVIAFAFRNDYLQ